MKTLNEIMNFYGTDKRYEEHNYVQFYEKILSGKENDSLKLLEIGIYRPPLHLKKIVENILTFNTPFVKKKMTAASLKTWYDYLPNTQIYGVDLDDFSDIDNSRIKTSICNQESKEELNGLIDRIGSDFDIIIDDGGHTMKQHQISLSVLFKHVKSGGIYVIEDLHTCYMNEYVNGDRKTDDLLREFQNTGKIVSDYMTEEEIQYLENNIDKVVMERGNISEIVFIYKK